MNSTGMETSGCGRLSGIVALERLEPQSRSVLETSESGFLDQAVAAGIDVERAGSDVVGAPNLDFLDRALFFSASDFVLERCLTLGPRASHTTFHDFAAFVRLGASHDAHVGLAGLDGALVNDIVFGEAVAVVQTSAVVDATGSFEGNFLATRASAGVPEFANVERIPGVVLSSFFDAASGHETSSIIDSCVAGHDKFVFGDVLVQRYAFSLIHAPGIDRTHFFVERFARVEIRTVFPLFVQLVFGALVQTGERLQRQQLVAAQRAPETIGPLVSRLTDFDLLELIGDATLRHDLAVVALVIETTTIRLGTVRRPVGTLTRRPIVQRGAETRTGQGQKQNQNQRTESNHDFF